ncbi:MAG: LysR family transcriptional regulator [Thalassovita sp.]
MVQKRSTRVSWDDLEAVMLVGRYGTVRAAAERIGVAHTTLAKRVSSAERTLGTVAFVRSVKGYTPTEAGRRVIAHAEKMAFEANAVVRHVGGADSELAGNVRISLVGSVLSDVLAPHLNAFAIRYPKITLEFDTRDGILDLDMQQADIAIRFQDNPNPDLVGRKIGKVNFSVYASRSFDMSQYEAGDMIPAISWGRKARAREAYRKLGFPTADIRWSAADLHAQIAMARAGIGLANLPCYMGDADPDLVQVSVVEPRRVSDIWVLTHASLKSSERVSAAFDFLVKTLRHEMGRFVGLSQK